MWRFEDLVHAAMLRLVLGSAVAWKEVVHKYASLPAFMCFIRSASAAQEDPPSPDVKEPG